MLEVSRLIRRHITRILLAQIETQEGNRRAELQPALAALSAVRAEE
jgi:hypothetical protein